MLKVNSRQLADLPSTLAQWADRAIGIAGAKVRIRLRSNKLYILCQGRHCPDRQMVLDRLIYALHVTQLQDLLPADQPPIQKIWVYGRILGEKHPNWTEQIDLKQLEAEKTRQQDSVGVKQFPLDDRPSLIMPEEKKSGPKKRGTSVQEQAQAGHPQAIAYYLSETLSNLGVQVKVLVKALPYTAEHSLSKEASQRLSHRLWVFCESAYSPDPSLIAAPIAQQLRELHLKGFRDAVILSQVTGEATPDWMLRVDLTPPEELLQEWVLWGDIEAIAKLLNQGLNSQGVEVSIVQKESTLHISCIGKATVPHQQDCLRAITLMLLPYAPRGIGAATIYGHKVVNSPPSWVDWLDLPANKNPDLAQSALTLAQMGDEAAIAFLLSRFLNPYLDWYLATGGIRIQVRIKDDLLHIMSDAPVCPSQRLVAAPSVQFVKQLEIIGITGIRVYGRRGGQKQPLWSHSVDLVTRHRQAPEATPEFPKSEEYVSDDLLVEEPEEPAAREAIGTSKVKFSWKQFQQKMAEAIANQLVRSQLFVPSETTRNFSHSTLSRSGQEIKIALIWGFVGLLLTTAVDLVTGQILHNNKVSQTSLAPLSAIADNPDDTDGNSLVSKITTDGKDGKFPQLSQQQSQTKNARVFDASGFTEPGAESILENTPIANLSNYPSFNNPLLDRKIALYQQRIAEKGPPDVLIVGSSRALRGIDPSTLQKVLATQGSGDVEIFNFGINGATAQVVDLLIRRILTSEQLPKLIIWADGARAFNSGRADNTFKSIATSLGYQKLISGSLPKTNSFEEKSANNLEPFTVTPLVSGTATNIWAVNARNIDDRLNQWLAKLSATYPQRELLQNSLCAQLSNSLSAPKSNHFPGGKKLSLNNSSWKNWNGFLPLAIQFDPNSYYQNHPRVGGAFDNDYRGFQLEGQQAIALETLVQFTKANQIPLVVVNLPLTETYLDPVRLQYEQEFELLMVRLSLSRGFIFRNWSQLWSNKNEYFSDPSHLNRDGAAAVSIRLAQDPLIPWPKKKAEP